MEVVNGKKLSHIGAGEVKRDVKKGLVLGWTALPYEPGSEDWQLHINYPNGGLVLVDARDGAVRRFKTAGAVLSVVRSFGMNPYYWGSQ